MKKVFVVVEIVPHEGEFMRGIYVTGKEAEQRRDELKDELFDLWGDETINGLEIREIKVGVPLENDHPSTLFNGVLHI